MTEFQEKYDEYVPWFTSNLWDKWESRGVNNIIRSKTHMASHMSSNIALYLYLLEDDTNKKNKYLSWIHAFNNSITSKSSSHNVKINEGFRNQLRLDDPHDGYVWSGTWGDMDGINDLTHTNAEIQSVINQYNHNIEWNLTDISLFTNTLNHIIEQANKDDLSDVPFFIDLSDNTGNVRTFSYGWAMLGRFNESTQLKLKKFSIQKNQDSYYYNVYLGIMTLNRAYLDDSVVYPE